MPRPSAPAKTSNRAVTPSVPAIAGTPLVGDAGADKEDLQGVARVRRGDAVGRHAAGRRGGDVDEADALRGVGGLDDVAPGRRAHREGEELEHQRQAQQPHVDPGEVAEARGDGTADLVDESHSPWPLAVGFPATCDHGVIVPYRYPTRRDTGYPSGCVDEGVPRMAGRTRRAAGLPGLVGSTSRARRSSTVSRRVTRRASPPSTARPRAREQVVGDGHRLVVGARHGDGDHVARARIGERQVLAEHVARLAVAARRAATGRSAGPRRRRDQRRVAGAVQRHAQVVGHAAVDRDPGRARRRALHVQHAVEGDAGGRDDRAGPAPAAGAAPAAERGAATAETALDVGVAGPGAGSPGA